MTSATEHGRIMLAAILPNRPDLLEEAQRQINDSHLPDRTLANIYAFLERYADVTGGSLPTRDALGEALRRRKLDAGTIAHYQEVFDLLVERQVDDGAFRWSIEQLRELAAERATGEAFTQAMEILTRGAEDDRGNQLLGHAAAWEQLLSRHAEIERDLSMQDAPEGDMRGEGKDILADYAKRKDARLHGHSTGIEFGIPTLDAKIGGINRGDLALIVGYTSEGKAQPLDAPVLTMRGWVAMGDLTVGDEVVDPEGQPSQVLGIYPQGIRPIFKVTFSDGSSAEATGDHLWDIRYWTPVKLGGVQKQTRLRATWTTDQIRARLESKGRAPALVEAPGLATIDFIENEVLPLDAYALGLLLGDGSLSKTPRFYNDPADHQLVDALAVRLPPGVHLAPELQTSRTPAYRLAGANRKRSIMRGHLTELGLVDLRSWEKFVPERYKWASAKTRLSVLQGLMDTDGSSERGRAIFSSASEQLRDDVLWLARSLGLRAAPLATKYPRYTYKDESRVGRPAYRVAVWEKPTTRVFRLQRKLQPLPVRDAGRVVVSIEHVRDAACQCIRVSAPSQLYVTRDFVPTHNTGLCVQLAWNACVMQGKNVVFLTTETPREQVRRRLISRHSMHPLFEYPAGLNSKDIKDGTLDDAGERMLTRVTDDFDRNPGHGRCYIVQVPRAAGMGYVEAKLTRLNRMFEVDLAVMDYFALLKADRRRNSDREELGSIIKEGKQICTTFNGGMGVPMVSPWQVNRTARLEAERTGYYASSALSETSEASNTPDILVSLLAPMDNDKRHARVRLQAMKHRDGERANSILADLDYATSCFTEDGSNGSARPGGRGGPSPAVDPYRALLGD